MAKSLNDILIQRKTIQPQAVSVSDIIRQEEADTKNNDASKLNKYFSDRSDIRKSISSWTLKTWRPAEDAFNVRTSKLIDLYLDDVSKKTNENWQPKFTSEQIINASKDLPWTLEKMKAYYKFNSPDKARAIDDYIQKGWVATNVFEYLNDISWNINNPYWVKKQEKENLFNEETPEAAKWVAAFGSFIPSMWVKWAWMFWESKIWKRMDEKLYNTYHKIWDTASDEEYKKYKAWQEEWLNLDATNMWWVNKRQLYEWYDKALSEWFVGSIDEYKNFEKNIHNVTSSALDNSLKEWILTDDDIESSKAAIIWDAVAEFITYMAMPITKYVEIDTAQPLLNMLATAWVDSIANTLEYAFLEWLQWDFDWDSIWDVWLINFLISWITRSPAMAKYIKELQSSKATSQWDKMVRKFLSTLPEKVENAFKNMNSETLERLWEWSKKEATNPEAAWIGRRWLWEKWVKAVEAIEKDTRNLWKQYETKISWLTEPVSEKWFFKEINDKFAELETQWAVSWGKWKAPKLELVKEWDSYKVKISNKKNLNKIKNDDGKWLWDAIQENVDSILEWYWIKLNQWSEYLIKQWVTNATKWTNWNVYEKQTQKLIEWLDNWDLDMPQDVKDLWTEIYEKKQLLKRAKEGLWIKWEYWAWKVWGRDRALDISRAWKNMSNEDAIAIIDILKSEWYLPKNIQSEIVAQWYLLWIENKNAWYSFLQGFYPSQAWEIEQVLELLRQKATAKDIENYINMLRKQEQAIIPSAWANLELPQLSDTWRYMQKAVWFGWWEAQLPTIQQWQGSTQPQISQEDYDAWYKQRYGWNM